MRRSTFLALALLLTAAPVSLAQAQSNACGDSHTIERGDTLGRIAQRCGVSLAALRAANPEADARRLQIGAQLSLPTGEAQGDAAGENTSGAAGGYTIQAGDTLGAIARRNNIELRSLMDANPGIRPRRLQIGQVIQMPGGTGAMSTADAGAGTRSMEETGMGGAEPGTEPVPPGDEPSSLESDTDTGGRRMGANAPAAGAQGTGGANSQMGAGAADSDALNIMPASGAVGTMVEMVGQGFEPGEQVSLRIGVDQQPAAEFATVQADQQGRIAVRMAIPEGPQPGQQLAFVATGASGAERSANFRVNTASGQQPSTSGTSPGRATSPPARGAPQGTDRGAGQERASPPPARRAPQDADQGAGQERASPPPARRAPQDADQGATPDEQAGESDGPPS